jgi:hypothetical protein
MKADPSVRVSRSQKKHRISADRARDSLRLDTDVHTFNDVIELHVQAQFIAQADVNIPLAAMTDVVVGIAWLTYAVVSAVP